MSLSKRSSKACTTCRQVKLRCDATKRFPNPCSRCENQGKTCLFDAGFKRRPVRGALEKVLAEKEELKRLVHSFQDDPSAIISASNVDPGSSRSPKTKDQPVPVLEDQTVDALAESSNSKTVYELDDVKLNSQMIDELFEHFRHHCFRHIPILDIYKPVNSIWKESRILFWTIVIISAGQHPVHCDQYSPLHLPFRRFLSEYLLNSIRSVYTIQALLLLCLWPFPIKHQKDDPSWSYCNLAVAAASQMGLDETRADWRPSSSKSSPEEIQVHLKTWLACFMVSTCIGADLGLPPPMSPIASIETSIRQRVQGLPVEFVSQLEIQQYSIRASTILNNNTSYPLQGSLVDLLERDLNVLENKMQNSASLAVRVDILAAKLRLYAVPLLSTQSIEAGYPDSLLKAVWYKGFHVAVELANIFARSIQECSTPKGSDDQRSRGSDQITVFYPKHYFRVLTMAGLHLLNILAIDQDMSPQDKDLANNQIRKICETLMQCSKVELDEFYLCARMLRLLSQHVDYRNYFKDDGTKPIPSIIDKGMKIARRVRQKEAELTRSGSIDPEMPETQTTSMTDLPGLQDSLSIFLDDDLSPEWNAWLSNDADFWEMLGSQPGHLPLGLN